MDDCFKDWIEDVVKVTGLDRNQIIRLALFSAPFSAVFVAQINERKKYDVNLPPPPWKRESGGGAWRSSTWKKEEREGDVNEFQRVQRNDSGGGNEEERRTGETSAVPTIRRPQTRPAASGRTRQVHQPGGAPKIFRPQAQEKTPSGGIKISL